MIRCDRSSAALAVVDWFFPGYARVPISCWANTAHVHVSGSVGPLAAPSPFLVVANKGVSRRRDISSGGRNSDTCSAAHVVYRYALCWQRYFVRTKPTTKCLVKLQVSCCARA
ncbi:unnamed protein product [Scytosiphon promiscuus]